MLLLPLLLAATVTATPPPAGNLAASGRRAAENAVRAADDAFGTSVGRESIGLYSADNVRGFSAIDAGNARIEGLYFDPVRLPTSRVQASNAIRVGIAAQGFAFPAPTGVVDFSLRRADGQAAATAFASGDTLGNFVGEIDAALPLTGSLALGIGLGVARERYPNGTTDRIHNQGVLLRWRPAPAFDITGFWSRRQVDDAQAYPLYIPAGAYLPQGIRRPRFQGPDWLVQSNVSVTYGLVADWRAGGGFGLRVGLFRSAVHPGVAYSNIIADLTPDGRGQQLVFADPPGSNGSTSGEVRLDWQASEGPRRHGLQLTLRGRLPNRRYGGSALGDLGAYDLDRPASAARPDFAFAPQVDDRIRQGTIGLGYEGRWPGRGEVTIGIQKTSYAKTLTATGSSVTDRASPWLVTAAGAVQITSRLTVYASMAQGLEDSGSAPTSATNRNEPLPASATSQQDAGVRWRLGGGLALVAGVFNVEKPYFQADGSNRFVRLGNIRNRGIEVSLTGAVTPRLDVVTGAVIADPRVSGPGLSGRPVDQARLRLIANANWRPKWVDGLSFDLGVTHIGNRAATVANDVTIPSRTLVDLGVRQAFNLGGSAAQLRLAVTNVGDVSGYDPLASGVYDVIAGRVVQLSLGVDF